MKMILDKKVWLSFWTGLVALPGLTASAATGGPEGFIFKNPLSGGPDNIFALIAKVLEFVAQVGSVVVVFAVIYSGYLFIKAQGNTDGIEEAKSVFFWTIIGAIVLLGAQVLAGVICNTAVSLGISDPGCSSMFR